MAEVDDAKEAEHLGKVERELARYTHPLFDWQARNARGGVEVIIVLKIKSIYDEPYRLQLKPREIESRGFEWDFQRQLYNCLHDYLVEMFTRSPHIIEL